MKRALILGLLAFASPALAAAPSDHSVSYCREAADVQACAVELDICMEKTAEAIEKADLTGTANYGLAITYSCLERQGVAIPNGDTLN